MTANPCPSCRKPMRHLDFRTTMEGDTVPMEDCDNPDCDMTGVTLAAGKHALLTPGQISEYKRMVAAARAEARLIEQERHR